MVVTESFEFRAKLKCSIYGRNRVGVLLLLLLDLKRGKNTLNPMHIVLLFTYFDKNEIKVGFHVKSSCLFHLFPGRILHGTRFIKEAPVKHL